MLTYLLRRVGIGLLMLVALTVLVFILLRLAPGDPVTAYINPSVPMSPEAVEALRVRLGSTSRCPCSISPG